jgi:hypothetical protein
MANFMQRASFIQKTSIASILRVSFLFFLNQVPGLALCLDSNTVIL